MNDLSRTTATAALRERGFSRVRPIRAALVATLLLGGVIACDGDTLKPDEVARVPSPDARADAVLLESSADATTPFLYEVFVVKHGDGVSGEPVLRLVAAVRNDSAYGANLRWQDAQTLRVEYLSARDAPKVTSPKIVAGIPIAIVAQDGVTDPAAPSGGMWFNLQRKGNGHSSGP